MRNYLRLTSIAVVAVLAALTLGSIGIAAAEPAQTDTDRPASGLRLGWDIREAGGTLADIVARLTGQDVDAIRDARADGQSFSAIAEADGVGSDAIVDGALAVRETVLADRVNAGDLTAEDAEALLADMEARLADRVDDTTEGCYGGGGGIGGGGRGQGGGGRGMGGGGCGGACLTQ